MDENNNSQVQGGSGSLVGSVIVVIILIIGAIYLFSQKAVTPTAPKTDGINPTVSDEVGGNTIPTAADDSLDAIEAEINASAMTGLEQDLNQLDQQLGN